MPINKILDDGIFISNNNFLKLIKVYPINFSLKSDLEKEAILNSYKSFLKVCDFDIQILIQSRKENLDSHISQIKNQINLENNYKITEISEMYLDYIKNINKIQNSSSKNFYILVNFPIQNDDDKYNIKLIRGSLNDKFIKIKDSLSRCGNAVFGVNSKKEIENIMFSFYNFRKVLNFI